MIVRLGNAQDIDGIESVAKAAGPADSLERLPIGPEHVGVTLYVAEFDGAVIAFIALRGLSPPAYVSGRSPLQLWRMGVLPKFHGKGIARALTGRALVHAHGGGYDVLWLQVASENTRGVAFYSKCGFVVAGTSASSGTTGSRMLVMACAF